MAVKNSKSARRERAATADIVGNTQRTEDKVPAKWKKQHGLLVKLRDTMLNRQGDLVKDAAEEQPAFSLHMADAGTDSYDRDLALSRISSEQDLVYEIDLALDRIRNGTYGICEATGKPIEPERLKAIPWTRFSAEAERKFEKDGSIRRPGLAHREAIARGSGSANEAAGSTSDEERQQE